MQDETEDLAETLFYTLTVIVRSDDQERRRIAVAYHEARILAAGIELDKGDARPRIEACLGRFNACRAVGAIEAAGWMLSALEERISERDLRHWKKLRMVAKQAADLLPSAPQSLH